MEDPSLSTLAPTHEDAPPQLDMMMPPPPMYHSSQLPAESQHPHWAHPCGMPSSHLPFHSIVHTHPVTKAVLVHFELHEFHNFLAFHFTGRTHTVETLNTQRLALLRENETQHKQIKELTIQVADSVKTNTELITAAKTTQEAQDALELRCASAESKLTLQQDALTQAMDRNKKLDNELAKLRYDVEQHRLKHDRLLVRCDELFQSERALTQQIMRAKVEMKEITDTSAVAQQQTQKHVVDLETQLAEWKKKVHHHKQEDEAVHVYEQKCSVEQKSSITVKPISLPSSSSSSSTSVHTRKQQSRERRATRSTVADNDNWDFDVKSVQAEMRSAEVQTDAPAPVGSLSEEDIVLQNIIPPKGMGKRAYMYLESVHVDVQRIIERCIISQTQRSTEITANEMMVAKLRMLFNRSLRERMDSARATETMCAACTVYSDNMIYLRMELDDSTKKRKIASQRHETDMKRCFLIMKLMYEHLINPKGVQISLSEKAQMERNLIAVAQYIGKRDMDGTLTVAATAGGSSDSTSASLSKSDDDTKAQTRSIMDALNSLLA